MKRLRLKDVDSGSQVSFLKAFAWAFPFLSVPGYFLQGWPGVALAVPVAAGLSVLVQLAAELSASICVDLLFFGTGKNTISLRERLSGTVSQARYCRMRREYGRSLELVGEVLRQDPGFAEVLFLKGQVLWEGFGLGAEAQKCLARVRVIEADPRATLHRWSRTLSAEIDKAETQGKVPAGGLGAARG